MILCLLLQHVASNACQCAAKQCHSLFFIFAVLIVAIRPHTYYKYTPLNISLCNCCVFVLWSVVILARNTRPRAQRTTNFTEIEFYRVIWFSNMAVICRHICEICRFGHKVIITRFDFLILHIRTKCCTLWTNCSRQLEHLWFNFSLTLVRYQIFYITLHYYLSLIRIFTHTERSNPFVNFNVRHHWQWRKHSLATSSNSRLMETGKAGLIHGRKAVIIIFSRSLLILTAELRLCTCRWEATRCWCPTCTSATPSPTTSERTRSLPRTSWAPVVMTSRSYDVRYVIHSSIDPLTPTVAICVQL